MLLFKEAQHARLFIGHVGCDRDQIKVSRAVHAIRILQIREFSYAGATPRSPKADDDDMARRVGAQLLQSRGIHLFYMDRFRVELLVCGLALWDFIRPLRRAAEDPG